MTSDRDAGPAAVRPVDVVIGTDEGERPVTLYVGRPDATVGDLAAALGWRGGHVAIDGRDVPAPTPLGATALRRGSLVTPTRCEARVEAIAALRWEGGPDAGTTHLLPPGPTVIGRAPGADVRRHDIAMPAYAGIVRVAARGDVTVTPLAPTVEPAGPGRWRVGRHIARIDGVPAPSAGAVGRRRADWTVAWNRPPRPAPPARPATVRPVEREAATLSAPPAGGLGGGLTSLVGGAVIAVLFRQPALLLFGAVGAVGAIGRWVWQQRRHRRERAAARRALAADRARFTVAVADATALETARRRAVVDLPAAVELATGRHSRLWERRPTDDDFMEVHLGSGDVPWTPPLGGAHAEPVLLTAVPVGVALRAGTVVGLVGDVSAARAVARSLVVQAVVASGPADLAVAVCAGTDDWSWVGWLPHHLDAGEDALGRLRLTVVDGETSSGGVQHGDTGIVVAPDALALPSACTHVVHVDADARLRVFTLAGGSTLAGVVGAGASRHTAETVARALAGLADPEWQRPDAELPTAVALGDVVGPTAEAGELATAWRAGRSGDQLVAAIGVGPSGRFAVDLVADGPHALVAGTTGAGKSELLRTLVASLAARYGPDDVTFLLIDYKGGSAFDACAALPHVVGVVTDLDDHLATRALRSLDAEIRRREAVLRAAGVTDISGHRSARPSSEPLPRLVVIVDEFAGLAADLPEFLASLVGVAQRGRSLGIHLVLATQRPAGVVNDAIRANTNLRVALRVQDVADSTDVLGVDAAARLPRDRPGRAVIRLGAGEHVTIQVASATAPVSARRRPVVEVVARGEPPSQQGDANGTVLDRLAVAAAGAVRALGLAPPRRPWLDPLPLELTFAAVPPGTAGLADDPDHQARRPVAWDRPAGNLLLCGGVGGGATSALATVAHAVAATTSPADLHLYAVTMGAADLPGVADLPHCGAVVRAPERERIGRLVRRLATEVERRRTGAVGPEVVLMVDGLPALRALLDDPAGYALLDALDDVVSSGGDVGVRTVATIDRPGAVPAAVASGFTQRWVLRLADPSDARAFGVPPALIASAPPGRGVRVEDGLEIQIARPPDAAASGTGRVVVGGPAPIGVLPASVDVAALPAPTGSGRGLILPIGIGDRGLEPAALVVHTGDHVLVTGRPRTGRTSALALVADRWRAAAVAGPVAVVALRRSWLCDVADGSVVTGAGGLATLASLRGPALVLVDDAEMVDDDGTLRALLTEAVPGVLVAAAGHPDALRSQYGHWTQLVRRSRLGVLLQPDSDVDGALLGATLPRRSSVGPHPGRGYLVVDGRPELVQLAHRAPAPSLAS